MRHEQDTLPAAAALTNLLALDEIGMGRLVQQFGWPRYRTYQILRWLYQRRAKDINQMTDLGQSERDTLASQAAIQRAAGCRVLRSIDYTRKFVLTLSDGLTIETVLIPDEDRLTLCVSTQVGCTLDCGFCLTGTIFSGSGISRMPLARLSSTFLMEVPFLSLHGIASAKEVLRSELPPEHGRTIATMLSCFQLPARLAAHLFAN